MRGRALFPMLVAATCILAPAARGQNVIEVAPDVFVRDADANQSFVLFDSFVVVLDAGSVADARILLDEITARTDKPIRYVINSHFHPDHTAGAQVLAPLGAEVIAHRNAKRDYDFWVADDFLSKSRHDPDTYQGLTYTPPTRYLDGTWIIDDGNQRLELIHYGHGHTSGDIVGWMPRVGVLFPTDLSTYCRHNLANASIAGWIAVLRRLKRLNPVTVVPGHGALAGPEVLDRSLRYLREIDSFASARVAEGASFAEIVEGVEAATYEDCSDVVVRDEEANLRRAYLEAGGTIDESGFGRIDTMALGAALVILAIFGGLWYTRIRRT